MATPAPPPSSEAPREAAAAATPRPRITDAHAAALLSLASGFVDAVGYIKAGIFAANMTGNTVLMGIALAHGEWLLALGRTGALVAFFVGGVAGRVLRRLAGDRPVFALGAEAALIAVAAFMSNDHALMITLIAVAMGVQATAMARFEGTVISTVVITSTMARMAEIVADLVATLLHRHLPPRAGGGGAAPPAALLASTWVSYALGAVVAVLVDPLTPYSLLLAAVLLLGLAGSVARARG